jgi:pSer/pThr/pTyr-binding forkhead associated (FHA) protein
MPTLIYESKEKELTRYPLIESSVTVGRDEACGVVLGSTGVSRRHFVLTKTEKGYSVEDLGSANGTYVNGEKVEGRTPLADGDKILVIGHILIYRSADLHAAPVAPRSAPPCRSFATTLKLVPEELAERMRKMFEEGG